MFDRLIADAIVVAHFAFIVFVLIGGLCVIYRRNVAWLHVPAVVWAAYTEFTSTICPLTPLENVFRAHAGQAGYEGGFVEHYLIPAIYPSGLTPRVQFALGAFVVAVNLVFYAIAWRRHRHA